jgi:prolyl oligopeptidase
MDAHLTRPARLFGAMLALLATAAALSAQGSRYPAARTVDQADTFHGTVVRDPYRWMEDPDAADTRAWIAAENAITFAYLDSIPQRAAIRDRLTKLWNYPKYSAPFREAGRYFWFENSGLQNQSVLYVRDGRKGTPRQLLDPNTLSADGTVALGALAVSNNGRWLGYGVSVSGSDWQEFHVRDIDTGRDQGDTLRWIKFSGISWTRDNRGFFYSRYDEPKGENALTAVVRAPKLCYHRLGTPQSQDILVYDRPDQPDWILRASVTDDGQYLIVSISQGTDERNRVYFIDLGDPRKPVVTQPVVKLLDRFDATYDFIDNEGSTFYFRTDLNAARARVIAINVDLPREEQWRSVIPESPDAMQSVALIGDRFVVSYLHDAHSLVRLVALHGGEAFGELALPGIGSVGGIAGKRGDDEFFYSFTSYLSPPSIYRYDLKQRTSTLERAPAVAFDPGLYESKQVFYTSKDGTRVPMIITARKGIPLDGTNPTLLYAYGGFNISLTPSFSPANIVWMEMGGIYAVANLRGGGEYGKEWHQGGMLLHKQNVFDDFIAAAEYLIKARYTSSSKLAVQGASNGGLLIGAVMTQRPDLMGVALPAVGVMDMLRFHKFTIGWAWTSDYGSADDSTQFRALVAYSPYHSIRPGTRYPATLVTTADHDDRVVPGHSFKFAAALQAAQAGPAPVLIRIDTKSGHGGGKPTAKRIDEVADIFAFTVKNLGMAPALP